MAQGMMTVKAIQLAERTNDAYSYDNYGEVGWRSAARELLRRGYDDRQVEAILRSKFTRWAADMASGREGWRYGRTTGADLGRFLDSMSADDRKRSVDELVIGTFGGAL
jgi:hypothetical protein